MEEQHEWKMSLSIRNDQCQRCKNVQNTKVVKPVKISRVLCIDEIVKDPSDRAETGADDVEDVEDAERIKGTPGYLVYLDRPSPQECQCRAKHLESRERRQRGTHDEQSRAAPEETVPDEGESSKAPPDMKTRRSMRTCLTQRRPHTKCARTEFKKRGDARVQGMSVGTKTR